MKTVTVVTKVLGINDSGVGNAGVNAETGECEVSQCVNMIPNESGYLTMAPEHKFLAKAPSPITTVFSGYGRTFVQCGAVLYRLDGDVFTAITAPDLVGTVAGVVTEIDARYTSNAITYKVVHGSNVASVCTAGVHVNPDKVITYSAMPAFSKAFTHGGALFVVTGEFVRSSEVNYYDCWDLTDTYVWAGSGITDAGSIPGCVVLLTVRKAIVITGYNKRDFKYTEYAISPVANTLWSGYSTDAGYLHMFIADDGVHVVTPDGKLVNTSKNKCNKSTFSGIFSGAVVNELGYFAYSDIGCVHQSMVSAGYFKTACYGTLYSNGLVADGDCLYTIDNTQHIGKFVLPPMSFGTEHKKRVRALYITGVIIGTVTVVLETDDGAISGVAETFTGLVQSARMQGFSTLLSTNVKVTVSFDGEYFELYSLTAHITVSPRY